MDLRHKTVKSGLQIALNYKLFIKSASTNKSINSQCLTFSSANFTHFRNKNLRSNESFSQFYNSVLN